MLETKPWHVFALNSQISFNDKTLKVSVTQGVTSLTSEDVEGLNDAYESSLLQRKVTIQQLR